MHTIIKIAVVSVLALFAIVGVVGISKAEENLTCKAIKVDSFRDAKPSDESWIKANLKKTFLISLLDKKLIVSQFSDSATPYQTIMHIVSTHILGTYAVSVKNGMHFSLVLEPDISKASGEMNGTFILQGTDYVNLWGLSCSQS